MTMSEKDRDKRQTGQGADGGLGEPDKDQASGAEPPAYRKTEEDSTMLNKEERTGEGTGSKAGEYS